MAFQGSHEVKKMKKYFGVILFMLLALLSNTVYAVDCSGNVTMLGFDSNWANPQLTISLSGGLAAVKICGLNAELNGVKAETCKIIHAELLAAKIAGRSVTFRFPDYADCKVIPGWQLAKIGWHTFN